MRRSSYLGVGFSLFFVYALYGCGDSESEKVQQPTTSTGGSSQGSGGSKSSGGSQSTSSGGSKSGGSGGSNATGGTTVTTTPDGVLYGQANAGEYHEGPVEWEGSYNNSCSPYPEEVRKLEGGMLAGLGLNFNGAGQLCDACILIKTNAGKSLVARVVTTGVTKAPNNIDLSKAAYDAIHTGEYPRSMTWQVMKCPDTGKILYQFQTEAHDDWSSLWVRNNRIPLEKVEVKSKKHASWFALKRGNDGTYTDGGGFGTGSFTLRLTAIDGQTLEDTFPGFNSGDLLTSQGQFP